MKFKVGDIFLFDTTNWIIIGNKDSTLYEFSKVISKEEMLAILI